MRAWARLRRRVPSGMRGLAAIDVLVAVAVFATGLLALAALQMGLLARAADQRVQREAASLARLGVEWSRAAGYAAIPVGLGQRQWIERALLAAGDVRTLVEIGSDLGLFGFDVTVDVILHVPDPASPDRFRAVSDATAAQAGMPAPALPQYKDIVQTFYWTDRWGRSQSLRFETAVAP